MTAKTAKPKPVTGSVTDAEEELAEAVALVTAMEERVREGDSGVSHEQINSARSVAEFARLRVDAAKRRVEAERVADRRARATQIAAEVAAHHLDGDTLADLLRTAVDSIVDFKERVDAHNTAVSDWLDRAWPLADEGNVDDILAVSTGGYDRALVVGEHRAQRFDPKIYIKAALYLVEQRANLDLEVPYSGMAGDSVYDNVRNAV